MIRRLVVSPEAEREAFEAATWYEGRSPRSAADFNRAFRAAVANVFENPLQYQAIDGEIRRAPVGKSPYGLLYFADDNEVIVLSCFHGHRNPVDWQRRLK